jgi:hypothetical protein
VRRRRPRSTETLEVRGGLGETSAEPQDRPATSDVPPSPPRISRVDSRQNRVAHNEALYREVNERIRDIHLELAATERTDILCECGRDDCTTPIGLSAAEYE